ncbi:MAG TPA: hypothetical protein VHC22_34375 [Pirellulales bacterium]|nr:hypothetical protein [Pirellulales bacterium]
MDGEQWIEEIGQPNAVRFGEKAKQSTVTVKAPGPACFDDFQCRLAVSVEQLVAEAAIAVLVGHVDGYGADPTHVADRGHRVG